MTHYKTLVETEWLGQWDLGPGTYVYTIKAVHRFVPLQRRKKRDPRTDKLRDEINNKLAIEFEGGSKQWLAGPTNLGVIAKLYGKDVEDWIGKRILLWVDPNVMMGKERTGGIRVRPTIPRPKDGEAPPPPSPVDPAKREQIDRALDAVGSHAPAMREPGEEG